MTVENSYVVWWEERLRDGTDSGASVVTGLGDAMKKANEIKGGIFGRDITARIFRLGAEVPLAEETIREPQPSLERVVYKLADGGPTG